MMSEGGANNARDRTKSLGMTFNVSTDEANSPMITDNNKGCTKDLCGLRSPDPRLRKRAQVGVCASCTLCCVIFLPLLFLVIIPAYVQSLVNHSDLVIVETTIINPTDTSFRSEVRQKFENTGDLDITAKIKMRDLDLTWKLPDTGDTATLVTLTDSNTITMEKGKTVTLKSTAVVQDVQALTLFNIYALGLEEVEWGVEGTADINGGTGDIRVDIDKQTTIKGFNHFPTDVVIQDIVITGGTPDVLINDIVATFTSPATIGIDFQQDVSFAVYSFGLPIGVGTIHNMYLKTGVFDVEADVALGYSNDQEYHQLMQVISNFTMGLNSPISLGPFSTATPIQWLAPGLSLISLPTFIPGLEEKLIGRVDMYPTSPTPVVIPFTMDINNPVDTEISLSYIKADIFTSGVHIAYVDSAVDIVIPAQTTVTSPLINATVIVFDGSHSQFYIDITSLLTGSIDEFPIMVNYSQYQILTEIHF